MSYVHMSRISSLYIKNVNSCNFPNRYKKKTVKTKLLTLTLRLCKWGFEYRTCARGGVELMALML